MIAELSLSILLGTVLAHAVFYWRYLNVPQNWAYVVNPASVIVWSMIYLVLLYLSFLIITGSEWGIRPRDGKKTETEEIKAD